MDTTGFRRRSPVAAALDRLTEVLLADSAASYRVFGAALLVIFAVVGVLLVFGMRVAPPSTVSICYGIALLLGLLLPWAWILTRRRLPAAVTFAFVLFLGFLLVSPRPLSYPVHDTSYAMLYNRDGYVLLSLLFLCVFVPVREPGRHDSALG